ncbi:MAG: T9SS type A sorting domain-containing protein [Saprospiraceae bacterium]
MCGLTVLSGQQLERLEIDFQESDRSLLFPLAGGLNSPQFSAVDLDNDGRMDLHVFDRVGNKQLTFLNNGSTIEFPYTYAPAYIQSFPDITNWMLLRDYNGDGIMDIFAYGDQVFDAVMVFTGYYEAGQIHFRRFTFNAPKNVIYTSLPGGNKTQLYVSMIDYPAVDDVDCDGDLDILTFNLVGGYVEFYKNQSVENGFGRDSLIYRLEDNCWGGFYESGVSNEVELAAQPGDCVNNLIAGGLEVRHTGSTLLTFDVDGDMNKELLLGDISFDQINLLHNGGDCNTAWMNDQDPDFPGYDLSAEVPVFPAAFYLDVDQDGLRDLLVAPNADLGGVDKEVVWWYKNVGTDDQVEFQFQQKDFLVEHMLDFGTGARPVFVDYNADGLQDLLVGNFSLYEPFGLKNARLFLYENTGTQEQAVYTLVDDDYLHLNQFSQSAYAFTPTFGDLDADGDLDAVIGEQFGRLFYAENTAGPGQPWTFSTPVYDYMGIQIGQASVPQIIDLDRDGLLDLVVGERNGNINYFRNKGSVTEASFSSDPDEMVLGGVDARVPGYTTGYSSPRFFEEAGRYLMLMGTEVGRLELYDNIDGNLNGDFTLLAETYGALKEGIRTHFDLADIDNDGLLEMVVGNFSGGIRFYQTDFPFVVAVRNEDLPSWELEIYPNPTAGLLRVKCPGTGQKQLKVFSSQGQCLYNTAVNGLEIEVDSEDWSAGVYWIQVLSDEGRGTGKVIKY